jgi:tungstate transport system substrate-binding protein
MEEGQRATRREIAWNGFIIVGPSADPAYVKGGSDSIATLKAIAASQGRSYLAATTVARTRLN